ncbi:hypothetical protein TNCT_674591 [Trichonephila clavata]|uniref:Uncharacterized protein n=1 Tax=Trichonephila clavata TaxID=2740835 RepID=A0A8X6G7H9_TRICU|nr:hypothetical protein TNCT_674591 [Trichonephila clavata]
METGTSSSEKKKNFVVKNKNKLGITFCLLPRPSPKVTLRMLLTSEKGGEGEFGIREGGREGGEEKSLDKGNTENNNVDDLSWYAKGKQLTQGSGGEFFCIIFQ